MKPSKRNPILTRNHSGSLATCEELKRAERWVRRTIVWTSLQMQKGLGVVSPRDTVRHLKANGLPISDAEYLRTTDKGRRVYQWSLL